MNAMSNASIEECSETRFALFIIVARKLSMVSS